ncbi:MAG: transposase, partial [Methanobacterium sp.]|nr:transposase [Methanobacterium sp.]
LDNYSTHKAVLVKKVAEILNINLIYLPEYSPDLNPIEDVWRVITLGLPHHLIIGLGEGFIFFILIILSGRLEDKLSKKATEPSPES